jgi:PRTRC genetic system protein B
MRDRFPTHSFEAARALVIYLRDDDQGLTYDSGSPRCFITCHRIEQGELSEGAPITRQALIDLCSLVMPGIRDSLRYLPETVLAYSAVSDTVIWWTPAQKRHVSFTESTGLRGGRVPLPALVFRVRGGSLSVWALKENRRPGPSTVLYHAPFFNTTYGQVCMGTTPTPETALPSDIPEWEEAFFGSPFTNEGNPQVKGITCQELWERLTGGEERSFPCRYLLKAGTLRTVLNTEEAI